MNYLINTKLFLASVSFTFVVLVSSFSPAIVIASTQSAISISPPVPTASSEYVLPFPGILPDHPLYFLKALRDKIVLFLTRDKIGKINLKRHFADKRLAMAILLFDKGKKALAIETLDDAESYLHQAITDLFVLLREEPNLDESNVERIEAAITKHSQVLGEMTTETNEEQQAIYQVLQLTKQSQQRLKEYRKGKIY